MNLVEYQSKLETMVELQQFDQRDHLEKLAASSPEHQRLWDDFLILEQAIPAWTRDLPDTDLVESVLAQLNNAAIFPVDPLESTEDLSAPTTPLRQHSTAWIWGTCLTAALLLIAVSVSFFSDRRDVSHGTTIATSIPNPPVSENPDKHAAAPHSFNQILRNAGAASWGLAQSTAGAMSEAVTLVPVAQSTPSTSEATTDESNWVDDINTEMQPIKDQINHAWNFIIHSVPETSRKI